MPVIYEPAGRAREYAPLAANLYAGCPHGCLYCYAPGALRRSRANFLKVHPRPGILKRFAKEVEKLAAGAGPLASGSASASLNAGPVLLSFSCDPYPAIEREHKLTQSALIRLLSDRIPVRILTKNPTLAVERDFDLLARAAASSTDRPLVQFGVSLSFINTSSREKWEPHAGTIAQRTAALQRAHDLGIPTWISMEPVVYPAEALRVIRGLDNVVDVWRIGKLNHDKLNESKVDWRKFLADVLRALTDRNANYRIKADLWAYADESILRRFPQRKGVPEE